MNINKDNLIFKFGGELCPSTGESSFKYDINIFAYSDGKELEIGNVSIIYFKNLYDVQSQLDEYSSTLPFMSLYKRNSIKFKKEVCDAIDMDEDMRSLVVIDVISIKEKYQGNKLTPYILETIFDYFNFDCLLVPIVLKAFPLQHQGKDDKFDIKEYKKDQKNLINYYKSIGFKVINKNGILGRNSTYIW